MFTNLKTRSQHATKIDKVEAGPAAVTMHVRAQPSWLRMHPEAALNTADSCHAAAVAALRSSENSHQAMLHANRNTLPNRNLARLESNQRQQEAVCLNVPSWVCEILSTQPAAMLRRQPSSYIHYDQSSVRCTFEVQLSGREGWTKTCHPAK